MEIDLETIFLAARILCLTVRTLYGIVRNMKDDRIEIRIKPELKGKAVKKAESQGLSLTSYITRLIAVNCKRMPDEEQSGKTNNNKKT